MHTSPLMRFSMGAVCLMVTAACSDNATVEPEEPTPQSTALTRGSRYCELVIVSMRDGETVAEVFGTQGLNDCPADAWNAIDAEALETELGAFFVKKNGPRYWLPNRTMGSGLTGQRETFGGIDMHLLATVEVDPAMMASGSYEEVAVNRTTTYHFDAGEEIFELTDDNGTKYVMQAFSQIVDASLQEGDLAQLGSRLALPNGWSFGARTLDADFVMTVEGQAVVVQDELENTYQRGEEGEVSQ